MTVKLCLRMQHELPHTLIVKSLFSWRKNKKDCHFLCDRNGLFLVKRTIRDEHTKCAKAVGGCARMRTTQHRFATVTRSSANIMQFCMTERPTQKVYCMIYGLVNSIHKTLTVYDDVFLCRQGDGDCFYGDIRFGRVIKSFVFICGTI